MGWDQGTRAAGIRRVSACQPLSASSQAIGRHFRRSESARGTATAHLQDDDPFRTNLCWPHEKSHISDSLHFPIEMDLVQTMLSCPVPRMEIVGHGRDVSRFPLPIARCFSLNGPPFQVELSVRFLCQQFLLYHGNLDVGVCVLVFGIRFSGSSHLHGSGALHPNNPTHTSTNTSLIRLAKNKR